MRLRKFGVAAFCASAVFGGISGRTIASAQVIPTSGGAQGPFFFAPPATNGNGAVLGGSNSSTNASFLAIQPSVNANQEISTAGSYLASGTQDYVCRLNASAVATWAFTGPRATLFGQPRWKSTTPPKVGDHYNLQGTPLAGSAADGPRWNFQSGEILRGRVIRSAPGVAGAIPWLLLQAEVEQTGSSAGLSRAAYIQRFSTVGGLAPAASTCTSSSVGATAQVPYSASYRVLLVNDEVETEGLGG